MLMADKVFVMEKLSFERIQVLVHALVTAFGF